MSRSPVTLVRPQRFCSWFYEYGCCAFMSACEPGSCLEPVEARRALELELQMAANLHAGARNSTVKPSLFHLSRPLLTQSRSSYASVQPLQTRQASGTLSCVLLNPQTLQFQGTIGLLCRSSHLPITLHCLCGSSHFQSSLTLQPHPSSPSILQCQMTNYPPLV